jgi:ring-1,2-phenylacetyl-CoA epoxidase subunit PaaE
MVFSQFANTKLKGEALEVGKPEGKFIFEPELDRQNYVLLYLEVDNTGTDIKSVLTSEPKALLY